MENFNISYRGDLKNVNIDTLTKSLYNGYWEVHSTRNTITTAYGYPPLNFNMDDLPSQYYLSDPLTPMSHQMYYMVGGNKYLFRDRYQEPYLKFPTGDEIQNGLQSDDDVIQNGLQTQSYWTQIHGHLGAGVYSLPTYFRSDYHSNSAFKDAQGRTDVYSNLLVLDYFNENENATGRKRPYHMWLPMLPLNDLYNVTNNKSYNTVMHKHVGGILEILSDDDMAIQIFHRYPDESTWIRTYENGVWSVWSSEIPSYLEPSDVERLEIISGTKTDGMFIHNSGYASNYDSKFLNPIVNLFSTSIKELKEPAKSVAELSSLLKNEIGLNKNVLANTSTTLTDLLFNPSLLTSKLFPSSSYPIEHIGPTITSILETEYLKYLGVAGAYYADLKAEMGNPDYKLPENGLNNIYDERNLYYKFKGTRHTRGIIKFIYDNIEALNKSRKILISEYNKSRKTDDTLYKQYVQNCLPKVDGVGTGKLSNLVTTATITSYLYTKNIRNKYDSTFSDAVVTPTVNLMSVKPYNGGDGKFLSYINTHSELGATEAFSYTTKAEKALRSTWSPIVKLSDTDILGRAVSEIGYKYRMINNDFRPNVIIGEAQNVSTEVFVSRVTSVTSYEVLVPKYVADNVETNGFYPVNFIIRMTKRGGERGGGSINLYTPAGEYFSKRFLISSLVNVANGNYIKFELEYVSGTTDDKFKFYGSDDNLEWKMEVYMQE